MSYFPTFSSLTVIYYIINLQTPRYQSILNIQSIFVWYYSNKYRVYYRYRTGNIYSGDFNECQRIAKQQNSTSTYT